MMWASNDDGWQVMCVF